MWIPNSQCLEAEVPEKIVKICICITFGYGGNITEVGVFNIFKLRDGLHLKQQAPECYLFQLNVQFRVMIGSEPKASKVSWIVRPEFWNKAILKELPQLFPR